MSKSEDKRWQLLKARAHVFISGRVQGVFFRSETRHEARKHGLTGWIRNLSDDRVEAVFEGEEENIRKLLEFCKQGPPGASVSSTDVSWQKYSGQFRDFEVTY
jgi:acylphosphatase